MNRRRWVLALFLAVIVAGVFLPVLGNGFLDYDDDTHITASAPVLRGLTGDGVIWALTAVDAGNWFPLTRLSHMADVSLFGLDPRGHHLTNLLLHAANTALLFLVLRAFTGALWPSAFAALLFGLHPLRVEPVAWAAERKELLAFFFGALTLAAYRRFVSRPGIRRMAPVALLFTLALAAKPVVVTLPVVLLLLDLWPLDRLRGALSGRAVGRLLAEKIPLAVLAAAGSVLTLAAQASGGALAMTVAPFAVRAVNALVSCVRYLGKTVWPARLSFFYPHPEAFWPAWAAAGALLALAAVSVIAWRLRRSRPWIGVGWLWFLVSLLPMIGLVQVGWQAAADRYTYVPQVGLCVIPPWETLLLTRRGERWRRAAVGIACCVLAAFAVQSRAQTLVWRDPKTLYAHALTLDGDNWLARQNLGVALLRTRDFDGALLHLEAAVRLRPRHANAWRQLGGARYARREYDAAIAAYERSLDIDPENAEAWYHLGGCRYARREYDAAIAAYERSLGLNPDSADAWTNLGTMQFAVGRVADALAASERALAINPRHGLALNNRAAARRRLEATSPPPQVPPPADSSRRR